MSDAPADAVVADIEARYARAYSDASAQDLAAMFAEDAMVQTEWGPVLDGAGDDRQGPRRAVRLAERRGHPAQPARAFARRRRMPMANISWRTASIG